MKGWIIMVFSVIGVNLLAQVLTNAAPQILEPSKVGIDLVTVFTVGAVVLGGAWKTARWMAKIEDHLEAQNTQRDLIQKDIQHIRGQLTSLPCGECPTQKGVAKD